MSASSAMATAARSVWMRFLGSSVNVKVVKYCIRMVVRALLMHSVVAVPSKTSHACASLATKMLVELDSTALVSNCNNYIFCYGDSQMLRKLHTLPFQISMSVSLGLTFVMRMPSVWILMEALTAHVTKGSLAMEQFAVSTMWCLGFQQIICCDFVLL